MSAQGRASVHIRYPFDLNPDDEAWLAVVAIRHSGVLADYVMESAPQQRIASFEAISDAHAFVDELTNSGRWQAQTMA